MQAHLECTPPRQDVASQRSPLSQKALARVGWLLRAAILPTGKFSSTLGLSFPEFQSIRQKDPSREGGSLVRVARIPPTPNPTF